MTPEIDVYNVFWRIGNLPNSIAKNFACHSAFRRLCSGFNWSVIEQFKAGVRQIVATLPDKLAREPAPLPNFRRRLAPGIFLADIQSGEKLSRGMNFRESSNSRDFASQPLTTLLAGDTFPRTRLHLTQSAMQVGKNWRVGETLLDKLRNHD
jgi:hypothetical protein